MGIPRKSTWSFDAVRWDSSQRLNSSKVLGRRREEGPPRYGSLTGFLAPRVRPPVFAFAWTFPPAEKKVTRKFKAGKKATDINKQAPTSLFLAALLFLLLFSPLALLYLLLLFLRLFFFFFFLYFDRVLIPASSLIFSNPFSAPLALVRLFRPLFPYYFTARHLQFWHQLQPAFGLTFLASKIQETIYVQAF